MLFKLTLKELWGSKKQLGVPAIAMAIAVGALFILEAFQFKIVAMIESQGRASLGADVRVRSVRPMALNEKERLAELFPSSTRSSSVVDFNTMLVREDSTKNRFVRLYAVDSNYPLYGEFQIEPEQNFKALDSPDARIFVPQSVADFLEVDIGASLRVGDQEFELTGIINKEPGGVVSAFSFAPTVFIHQRFLDSTGLFSRPGRVDYIQYYGLPNGEKSPADWVKPVEESLGDPIFSVRSYDESDRGFQRLYEQIRFFGQIVSIVAILISSFSIFGTLQTWFFERRYLVALLRCYGASSSQIRGFLSWSVGLLAALAASLGLFFGAIAEQLISPYLEKVIDVPPGLSLPAYVYLVPWFMGVLATVLFSILAMMDALKFKPILLIRKQVQASKFNPAKIFTLVALLVFFCLSAWYFVEDAKRFFYLVGGIFGAIFLAGVLSYLLYSLLKRLPSGKNLLMNYAARSLLREKRASLVNGGLILVIATFLSFIFLMQQALMKEFEVDPKTRQSSLFIFDIGEERKVRVEEFLESWPESRSFWSSWVSVRWTSKNGGPTIEDAEKEKARHTEFQMGIRRELPENQSVVAGEFWSEGYQSGLVEVSLSKGYADSIGIELGDVLGFRLYGVDFEAEVTSLRRVRWTDFQPGFRFVFQDGYFEDLPRNYLASIETINDENRIDIMNAFTREFPSVSLIDLSSVKRELIDVTNRISLVLVMIILFLLLVGASLVGALAVEKLSTRRLEFASLRCFGGSKAQLLGILSIEFLYLSLLPAIFGLGIGLVLANFVLFNFFAIYQVQWANTLLLIPLGISAVILIVGLLGTRRLLAIKPRLILSDQ